MRVPIIRPPLQAVAVALGLLAVVAIAITLKSGGEPDRPSLVGVPARAYDGSGGLELLEPGSVDTRSFVSAQDAAQAAESAVGYGNGFVRQVVLARYLNTNAVLDIENVVWAVNFEPYSVEWHRPAACGLGCAGIQDEKMETTFAALLIDAETGEVAGELMSGCQPLDFESLDPFVFGARQLPLNLC